VNGALFSSEAKMNLVSTNSILRTTQGKPTGHSYIDGPSGPFLVLKDGTIIPLKLQNGLVSVPTTEAQAFAATFGKKEFNMLELHERLGHLNVADVRRLADSCEITLVDDNEEFFCEACALGKSTRTSVPSTAADRSQRAEEIIHSDIIPFEVPSFSGFKYAAVFIMDQSRYARVYGMKRKSDLPAAFSDFVCDMRTLGEVAQFNGQRYILQTDAGTEYKSKHFVELCSKHLVRVRYAAPKTQSQNGVCERWVRSVTEMMRTLLIAANRPKQYWYLALRHATLLRNVSPTKALTNSPKGFSPHQNFVGKNFDITKLHVWGTDAYVHVEKDDRTRLEPRARKGTYVGFDESSNCDLVYFLDSKRLVSSYHITIDETRRQVQAVHSVDPFAEDAHHAPSDSQQSTPTALIAPDVGSGHATQDSTAEGVQGPPHAEADLPPPAIPIDQPIPGSTALVAKDAVNKSDTSVQVEGRTQIATDTHVPNKDPGSLKEALESEDAREWEDAYITELHNLLGFGTFILVPRNTIPSNTKVIGHKVVCKTKYGENGEEIKKKCRIVAKGFMENTEGQLTFAPVSNYSSIRIVLAIAAALDLDLHQADIKSAYLLSSMPEGRDTYMTVPEGLTKYDENGNELVCKLTRSIYGLSSSGRLWSDELCAFMKQQGFKRSHAEPALYYKGSGKNIFLVSSHVDDLLMAANRKSIAIFLKALKAAKIDVSSQGELKFLLNMQVTRDRANKTVTLHQSAYVNTLLENFNMKDANTSSTPMTPHIKLGKEDDDKIAGTRASEPARYAELVGSLLYLSNTVRPDIAAHVGQLARFISGPSLHHWNEAVRILKYLKGTATLGLTYSGNAADLNQVHGYADSDWGGCKDTKRSTGGYVFMLNNAAISWSSKRQNIVALSTAEAELVAVSAATQEATHLKMLLEEMGFTQSPITIYEDNRPCIKIAENPITSNRSKHIDIRHFYVRDKITDKTVQLKGIGTNDMVADCLTKSLDKAAVEKHRAVMFGEHVSK
jgi:hypothetical protein